MSNKKYTCPPQTASGQGTFSDNLVGFQLVQGGGLTQGNYEFIESTTEKRNRNFITGTFSEPINLDSLGVNSINQSKLIVENNFKVYPNFDLTQISTFTLYGSMVKRMLASVTNIISYFPAALESTFLGVNYTTGVTADNIVYNKTNNETSFELNILRIRNPFDIDFTNNSKRNLELREVKVSKLRDLTNNYSSYSLFYNNNYFELNGIVPTNTTSYGTLKIYVKGNPFSGQSFVYDDLVIRPNDYEVNKIFNEEFDEVEKFLLNRTISPIYTSTFNIPTESNDGTFYVSKKQLTWPLYGKWNLDILTGAFTNYLQSLNEISEFFDLYQTNLVSRFLTTGALKEFDTIGQKMEKVLQIYGRSFDETKKFISSLSYITSVNYNVGNDISSQLLKNLSKTLGWNDNISPISNEDLLSSVFGQKNSEKSVFPGTSVSQTPDELNYQYYRNLLLNSAYLFKSKGTRKSIEILMKMIGAPEALIDFNEHVYLADQRIDINEFDKQYAQISGGTYVRQLPTLESGNIYTIYGVEYTGFTTTMVISDANITKDEYPIDDYGYPETPINSEDFFFQIGSGWFEQTPQHRAPESVDFTGSVFTGQNPNYQTYLLPYNYGQIYLNRYRKFPYMSLGFKLSKQIDNNKSWVDSEIGLRTNLDGNLNALYEVSDDKLVLNVKNVDLFLNPAQALSYDVWNMSREYNYPISNQGYYLNELKCSNVSKLFQEGDDFLMMDGSQYIYQFIDDTNNSFNSIYPIRKGIDWTYINPQPKRQTFFEFAQTFWKNMINVRNRQYITNGKTGGYPTLESVYWKYLESYELVGLENNKFTYDKMIEYVKGMGDYWIRLVEQMVPATTLWNTGVRYENSIFHRQKFVWKRPIKYRIASVAYTKSLYE